jgi:hypothetical protein
VERNFLGALQKPDAADGNELNSDLKRDIAGCFLRLAGLRTNALDRLSRYEHGRLRDQLLAETSSTRSRTPAVLEAWRCRTAVRPCAHRCHRRPTGHPDRQTPTKKVSSLSKRRRNRRIKYHFKVGPPIYWNVGITLL